jgi:hypothetical protein
MVTPTSSIFNLNKHEHSALTKGQVYAEKRWKTCQEALEDLRALQKEEWKQARKWPNSLRGLLAASSSVSPDVFNGFGRRKIPKNKISAIRKLEKTQGTLLSMSW